MAITTRTTLAISAAAITLSLAFAPSVFAQDKMTKDDGMKKETMSKDSMKKGDGMSHDAMSHDSMKKGDGMQKDGMMKKDEMKK